MSFLRRAITLSSSALTTLLSTGQQHSFVHYTTRDGLSQSQVRCMAQDERGYLWFGTLGGLSRFDGAVFTNYALQERLPNAQVNALWSDADGLWIGAGEHLARFDGPTFVPVTLPGSEEARIMAVVGGAAGERFIATDGAGVFRSAGGKVEPLPGYPSDTALSARALLWQADGTLFIGLRNGLLKWKEGTCTAVPLGDARAKSVSALSIDDEGTLWVGTFGDGLFQIRNDVSIRNITEEEGLLQNNVRCLLTDERGRTWVGTKFGLNLLDGQRIRAYTVHQGLPNDNIWCAMMDRDGQLWFGTDGAGVLRYTGDRFVTFTTTDGLCSDQVMSITADEAGDLWLGTYGNGICRMDAMAMITTLDGLPNNTIWCGLRDRQGRMWFGTSDGLCRIEKGEVVPLSPDAALKDERVLSLFEAPDGTLWCGTREGLSSITQDGHLVTRPASEKGPGRSIRSIVQDVRGRFWLATDEGSPCSTALSSNAIRQRKVWRTTPCSACSTTHVVAYGPGPRTACPVWRTDVSKPSASGRTSGRTMSTCSSPVRMAAFGPAPTTGSSPFIPTACWQMPPAPSISIWPTACVTLNSI